MAVQAGVHRGNIVPAGGVTPNVVGGVAGGGMIMADTIQLQEMSDLFMENSEMNYLQMSPVPLRSGEVANFTLQTVGLGEELELLIRGDIVLRNNHATVAETVTLPEDFPYNLLRNINLVFNGQASIVNASAFDLLTLAIKRNLRSGFVVGSATPGRLHPRFCSVSVTGGTLIAGGNGVTGFRQLTIPAVSNATVSVSFFLPIPFVLRKDLLIGLLPMANTSVHANTEVTMAAFTGPTRDFPFMGTEHLALVSSTLNMIPTYKFWGLPEQKELYSHFVGTSYVVTRYANRPITTVGATAIAYEVPINFWLVSALMSIRNNERALQMIADVVDNPHLVYNGTITVDRTNIRTKLARDLMHYGCELPIGQLLFDYSQTGNLDANSANMSRWLNMYQASNPMLYADIVALSVPGSFDVTLERLAPNYVQVV